ncbi:MAG: hypothetical protein EXX96DRAFT_590424 [Benjaminiella poitrasii]|nr:MAG: hypothetical protein EXX96DRAFT_590424 [Benjaminiella poitrasii]
MTEYATNNMDYHHLIMPRRPSIRRGTISSISKDVRINNFEEIIKQQKAIQQKERSMMLNNESIVSERTQQLRRRHSMLNMSNNFALNRTQTQQTTIKQPQRNNNVNQVPRRLPSRMRTMSTYDLKSSNCWMMDACGKEDAVVMTSSAKARLDEKIKGGKSSLQQQCQLRQQFTVNNAPQSTIGNIHNNLCIRKCEACPITNVNHSIMDNDNRCVESPTNIMDDDSSNYCSSSQHNDTTISDNTSLSNKRPIQQEADFTKQYNMKQVETVMNDLKSCSIRCVNQIHKAISNSNIIMTQQQKDIHQKKQAAMIEEDKDLTATLIKSQIKECKIFVLEQQNLLNRFEQEVQVLFLENVKEEQNHKKESFVVRDNKKDSHPLESICPDWLLSVVKNKSSTQEDDTVFSFQGVCTTVKAPSSVPDRLLLSVNKADDDKYSSSSKKSLLYFRYSIYLTLTDRQCKFVLLSVDNWQKDERVTHCEDKYCQQEFNWFQRKHHCRRCGHIYCNTHSGNRLPLFTAENTNKPIFSRVCDTCFFSLVEEDSLIHL